jgi:hypothetical protein
MRKIMRAKTPDPEANMKKQQNRFKGTWMSRILAILLPFLLLSLVAWTANGQDSRGTAGALDCDPMTACFLDLVITMAKAKNAAEHPVGPNEEVPWSQGPEDPPVNPPPNIIVILADDMGFNDISLYNGETTSTIPTPEIDSLAAEGIYLGRRDRYRFPRGGGRCLYQRLCGQRDVRPLEGRPPDRQVFDPIRL